MRKETLSVKSKKEKKLEKKTKKLKKKAKRLKKKFANRVAELEVGMYSLAEKYVSAVTRLMQEEKDEG